MLYRSKPPEIKGGHAIESELSTPRAGVNSADPTTPTDETRYAETP